ncbi:hypothetical protein K8I28_06680 [bacterium]|nr:hypothetical protein [bacterium]
MNVRIISGEVKQVILEYRFHSRHSSMVLAGFEEPDRRLSIQEGADIINVRNSTGTQYSRNI